MKYATQRYCSQYCGSRASVKHTGVDRPERRKVERPSAERLVRDIKELGYVGTGRKYGVSDNAVRKWGRRYGLSPGLSARSRKRSPVASTAPASPSVEDR